MASSLVLMASALVFCSLPLLRASSHGLYSGLPPMASSQGLYSSPLLMAFIPDLYSWPLLMASSHVLYSWSLLTASTHGLHPRPLLWSPVPCSDACLSLFWVNNSPLTSFTKGNVASGAVKAPGASSGRSARDQAACDLRGPGRLLLKYMAPIHHVGYHAQWPPSYVHH